MVSDNVQQAFERVKDDINSLKRLILGLKSEVDSLASKSVDPVQKKELYDFINALDRRLKDMESRLVSTTQLETALDAKEKAHSKTDAAIEKSLSKLQSDVSDMHSDHAGYGKQLKDISKTLSKLEDDNDNLAASATEAVSMDELVTELDKIRLDIADAKKKAAQAELRAAEIPDFSRLTKRLDEIEQKLSETRALLKEADVKELKAELSELTKSFSKQGKKYATLADVERAEKSTASGMANAEQALKDDIERLKISVDQIVSSEVDLGEYVEKHELRESLGVVRKDLDKLRHESEKKSEKSEENLKEKLRKASDESDELRKEVSLLRSKLERFQDGTNTKLSGYEKTDKKELAKLREDVDYIKSNLVTHKDVDKAVSGVYSEVEGIKSHKKHAHEDQVSSGGGPGIGNYVTVLVLLFILFALGYFVYTSIVPGQTVLENITAEPSAITATQQNKTLQVQQNQSQPQNLTPSVQPQGLNLTKKNNECVASYECTLDTSNRTNFLCYYDSNLTDCRCFKGTNLSGKNMSCSPQRLAELAQMRSTGAPQWASARLYLVAFASMVGFGLLLFYLMKKGEEASKEDEAEEKKKKKNE